MLFNFQFLLIINIILHLFCIFGASVCTIRYFTVKIEIYNPYITDISFIFTLPKMAHLPVQAQAISIMNIKMIKKEDLPGDYSALAIKWLLVDKNVLLASDFKDYWVIVKNTQNSISNYHLHCGSNVPWSNTSYSIPDKLPSIILVIENNDFKGVIIGDTIIDLIKLGIYGIYLWMSPLHTPSTSTSAPHFVIAPITNPSPSTPTSLLEFMRVNSAPAPSAYIQAGGTLIPVPAGYTAQVIPRIPNQFEPMMNISHFKVVRR